MTFPIDANNRTESRRSNGIDYIYEFLEDGWIAIYKNIYGRLSPVIQAKTIEKADEYIHFIEPAPIGMARLV